MKIWNRIAAFICLFSMIFSLTACSLAEEIENNRLELQNAKKEYYVAFCERDDESPEAVKADAWDDYIAPSRAFSSTVYYDSLDLSGKRIYRLLEYAMTEGFARIYIDQRMVEESETDLYDILLFLALDSPYLEQNLNAMSGTASLGVETETSRLEFSVPVSFLEVSAFSEERNEKRDLAVSAARSIVKSAPDFQESEELAEWYYEYLTEKVSYREYEEDEPHYLYDALITGTTQCDGFANAYSLLCNLSGIPSFEKQYLPEDDQKAGHTWNSICTDGQWTNVDCALGDDSVQYERECNVAVRFAFGDEYQIAEPMFASRLPKCDKSRYECEASFSSDRDPLLLHRVNTLFSQDQDGVILIEIQSGNLSDEVFQEIAQAQNRAVACIQSVWNEKHYFFLILR